MFFMALEATSGFLCLHSGRLTVRTLSAPPSISMTLLGHVDQLGDMIAEARAKRMDAHGSLGLVMEPDTKRRAKAALWGAIGAVMMLAAIYAAFE
jgi:hypothetical protein